MSVKFKLVLFLSIVLFVSLFSTAALAESDMSGMDMPGMDMSGDQTMTPSEEMVKNQGLNTYKPKETMLSGDQQNLMQAGVVGVFIIFPVSVWIVTHQRRRARRLAADSEQTDS